MENNEKKRVWGINTVDDSLYKNLLLYFTKNKHIIIAS